MNFFQSQPRTKQLDDVVDAVRRAEAGSLQPRSTGQPLSPQRPTADDLSRFFHVGLQYTLELLADLIAAGRLHEHPATSPSQRRYSAAT